MKPGWWLGLQRRLLNGGRRAEQEEGLVQQAGEQRQWVHCPQAKAGCVTARECSGKATDSSSSLRKSHQPSHSCSSIYRTGRASALYNAAQMFSMWSHTGFIRCVPGEVCFCLPALGLSLNGNTLNHILQSAPS